MGKFQYDTSGPGHEKPFGDSSTSDFLSIEVELAIAIARLRSGSDDWVLGHL